MDSGVNDLLELMELADIPRTREDYIAVAWGDEPPVPWTAELESELPEDLQDWSLFDVVDGRLQKKGVDSVYLDHWMRREFNPDEPRDEQGRWTDGGGSDGGNDSAGVEFVSPSVASHLDFHEAVSGLKSPQQKALREAGAVIDEALHEKTTAYNIIGAWSDGAENSVASFHPKSDFERLRVSGAMKGHLADQKQVLIFQQHAGKTAGDAVLYNFEAKGSLADIHQNLLEDGIAFHTLVPNSGGATVLVADLDGSMADAVEKGSARYDAQVGVRFGQAEFIGTTKEDGSDREQRDSARASYEKIIAESPVQGSGEIWRRVRDTYGEASVGADTIPGYKPGIQAVNDDSKIKATKAEWITGSPIKTIEQAVGAAGAAQDALGKAGEAIASKLGVDFKNPGPKSKSEKGIARIKEKAALRGGRVAAVTDIARATFVVNDPKQVDAIAADLGKKFEVTLENWRKNDQGYMDRAALVRFGNGLIGEVQFMDPGMSDAKSDTGGNGHGLYAEWRALDMSKPAEREKADKLVGQMRALYGKVTSGYSPAWRAALGAAM